MANKKCKFDAVPVFIFKSLKDIFSPIISNLFNASIVEGIFPTALKNAVITPVYKSGPVNLVNNFRPISILSTLSKLFEKLMCTRLKKFIACTNFLKDNQFGFRENNSTNDAILELLDMCYSSLDSRKYFVTVFLDLSKAFDTLDHGILLAKMNHMGVRGTLLK